MARSVTGEGIAQRPIATTLTMFLNPGFACGYNNHRSRLGSDQGAAASAKCSVAAQRLMKRAIKQGEFLFSVDPATAAYPGGTSSKPSPNWWKLGFPVFYVTDLLQNVEALTALGYGRDKRLVNALALIRDKQDDQGRWSLEYEYRTWVSFGPKRQPNKWVTLRALRVLKAVA
jgi:hypothetical protein